MPLLLILSFKAFSHYIISFCCIDGANISDGRYGSISPMILALVFHRWIANWYLANAITLNLAGLVWSPNISLVYMNKT